jgi:TonB family protein
MSTRRVRAPSVRIADCRVSAPLVRRAARSTPAELAERLEEEWLADLVMRSNSFARLRLVLGCFWASRVIAHDCLLAGVTAQAGSNHDGVVTLGRRSSQRTTIFMLIVGLHVVAIYALASVFAIHGFKKPPSVLTGSLLPYTPPKPDVVPLPPADPALRHPGAIVPDLAIPDFEVAPTTSTEDTHKETGIVAKQDLGDDHGVIVKRISGGPGAGFPNTEDYYPASAIRQGEEGAAAVQVCVNEKGKLTTDPALVQSSGYALLDEGALRLAKAGSGHYRSSTEDGRPISDCYAYSVRFKLKR